MTTCTHSVRWLIAEAGLIGASAAYAADVHSLPPRPTWLRSDVHEPLLHHAGESKRHVQEQVDVPALRPGARVRPRGAARGAIQSDSRLESTDPANLAFSWR